MVILMIIVMSYQAVGNLFHEVAGAALFVLFLVHNILNRKWYQNIARGKYSMFRKTMLVVDILTLISMLSAMGTGIYLSQSIFAPLLGMREGYLIRPWHVAAGAWGTILVSVHGGMHIRIPKERKAVLIVCGILLFGIGIWAFLVLDMPNRLLFREMGEYWRYSSILLFVANAAVMAFFAVLSAVLTAKVKEIRK